MKKSIKIVIVALVMALIIGGVIYITAFSGNKKVITIEQFEESAKEEGYTIAQTADNNKENSPVTNAKVAIKEDYSYVIKFYELKDEESAKTFYNENKENFSKDKKEGDSLEEKSEKNYQTYTLKSDTQYGYLARVDNTVISLKVDKSSEQEVTEFVKKLGY